MPDQFHGVLPALITPFTEDGADLDAGALAAIVERLVAGGAGGLVPGGSTGEFTTLSHGERRRLVEITIDAAAGRVPVVAGTGALSTAETIELSVHAERAGAAAVMIVPPFYDPLGWRELLAHYRAVAARLTIPIVYYNLPAATGVTLAPDQFRELRRVAGVTALKDTGGDAVAAAALLHGGEELPTLLNGWDTLTFAALAAGVRAVIWGAASILPEQCVALHRLLIDDDRPARRTRPVDPPAPALQLPRGAQLLRRGEGRVRDRRGPHRTGPRPAARARRRRRRGAGAADRARPRAGGRARGRLRRPWTLAYASALLSHGPSR